MYAQFINNTWKILYGNIEFSHNVYQNPETLTDEQKREFGVYKIVDTPRPELDNLHKYGSPIFTIIDNNTVERSYEVLEKTSEELVAEEQSKIMEIEFLRKGAYREESDPLFFKWQRGEVEQQVWLDKVSEIKNRYK